MSERLISDPNSLAHASSELSDRSHLKSGASILDGEQSPADTIQFNARVLFDGVTGGDGGGRVKKKRKGLDNQN